MHYAAGKLLAIGLIISLTTTLPALILFFEYGLLGDTGKYLGKNTRSFGILGYGALLSVAVGLLLFALVSWMPKPVPLVLLWEGFLGFASPQPSSLLLRREAGMSRRDSDG